jgi:ApaG protein
MMEAFFPYAATTQGVTVRVSVSFLADKSEPERARWVWAYHIRIENHREAPVQLLARHWRIGDGRGAVYQRDGEGVVGEQPVIQPGGSFDYVSGCPLTTPTGWMEGRYAVLDHDGGLLQIEIPHFPLIASPVSG